MDVYLQVCREVGDRSVAQVSDADVYIETIWVLRLVRGGREERRVNDVEEFEVVRPAFNCQHLFTPSNITKLSWPGQLYLGPMHTLQSCDRKLASLIILCQFRTSRSIRHPFITRFPQLVYVFL